MVSMKDIASRCGVSVATVSKALNDHQDISRETRERICAVANEMGYLANSAARALKTNRTYNIGVLFVDEKNSGLAHDYFSAVLDSLRVEAEACGYDITFINKNVGGKPTTYLQHCLYRGVDGVVIACVDFNDPRVRELVESAIPLVTIDRIFDNRLAVLSDNVNGVSSLVRHVYSLGHRKIAFLHGEMTSVTKNRLVGFHKACEELGIRVPEEYIIECVYHDPDRCAEATRKLLELPDRPTCILFPDDFSYIGGMNVLLEAGLRIPEDISVVGYDGISMARYAVPRLTTVRQDTQHLAEQGVEVLLRSIEGRQGPTHGVVPFQLVLGESVCQPGTK